MHTAHSDGQCLSQSGKRVPCPAFVTVQAAIRAGVDYIASDQYEILGKLVRTYKPSASSAH